MRLFGGFGGARREGDASSPPSSAPSSVSSVPYVSAGPRPGPEAGDCSSLRVLNVSAEPAAQMHPNVPAMPFETPHFRGKLLLFIRTQPLAPFARSRFEGRQRMFEVQIQGEFLTAPTSTVYFGCQVPQQMSLSLIGRSLCGAILRVLKTLAREMHVSFGSADGSERPHICYPLASSMDKLVATPAGKPPPELGGDIPEPADEAAARKRGSWAHGSFQKGYTYTMSFHSAYVDLLTWEVVNLPGLPRMTLTQFWETMPFLFVAYDVAASSGRAAEGVHSEADLRHYFRFECQHAANLQAEAASLASAAADASTASAAGGAAAMGAGGAGGDDSPSGRGPSLLEMVGASSASAVALASPSASDADEFRVSDLRAGGGPEYEDALSSQPTSAPPSQPISPKTSASAPPFAAWLLPRRADAHADGGAQRRPPHGPAWLRANGRGSSRAMPLAAPSAVLGGANAPPLSIGAAAWLRTVTGEMLLVLLVDDKRRARNAAAGSASSGSGSASEPHGLRARSRSAPRPGRAEPARTTRYALLRTEAQVRAAVMPRRSGAPPFAARSAADAARRRTSASPPPAAGGGGQQPIPPAPAGAPAAAAAAGAAASSAAAAAAVAAAAASSAVAASGAVAAAIAAGAAAVRSAPRGALEGGAPPSSADAAEAARVSAAMLPHAEQRLIRLDAALMRACESASHADDAARAVDVHVAARAERAKGLLGALLTDAPPAATDVLGERRARAQFVGMERRLTLPGGEKGGGGIGGGGGGGAGGGGGGGGPLVGQLAAATRGASARGAPQPPQPPPAPAAAGAAVLLQGAVARAHYEAFWAEEWATLTGSTLTFERRAPTFDTSVGPAGGVGAWRSHALRIPLGSVLGVAAEPAPELEPLFAGVAVETVGRTYYFFCKGARDRDGWTHAISRALERQRQRAAAAARRAGPGGAVSVRGADAAELLLYEDGGPGAASAPQRTMQSVQGAFARVGESLRAATAGGGGGGGAAGPPHAPADGAAAGAGPPLGAPSPPPSPAESSAHAAASAAAGGGMAGLGLGGLVGGVRARLAAVGAGGATPGASGAEAGAVSLGAASLARSSEAGADGVPAPRAGADGGEAEEAADREGAVHDVASAFALSARPWARASGRLVLNQKCMYWQPADALARALTPPRWADGGGGGGGGGGAAGGGGGGGGGGGMALPAAVHLPAHIQAYVSLPELSARLLECVLELTAESARAELAALCTAASLLRLCVAEDSVQARHGVDTRAAGLACWLNLYHTLVAHALLTFGPPRGPRHFNALHRTACYALADGTFSPADVEHCVLRARLSKPRVGWLLQQLIAAGHSPLTPSLSAIGGTDAVRADVRINFALCSGSRACLDSVPVYTAERLEAQLSAYVGQYLDTFVHVDAARATVTLPKMVEWYAHDFGPSGSPSECLRAISALLPASSSCRAELEALLRKTRKPAVRFAAYNWACHNRLRRWLPSSGDDLAGPSATGKQAGSGARV